MKQQHWHAASAGSLVRQPWHRRYRWLTLAMFLSPILYGRAEAQIITAHRGASHDAPENTLAAFRLAWEQGADAIEADFHLSSDRRIVCIHDKDTERTAGVKHVVAQTPLAKLQNLDVGAWKGEKWKGEKIPTLAEVLEVVPYDKQIFIELKTGPEIVPLLQIALANSALRPEQTVIISFHAETIAAVEKRLPHVKTHLLVGYDEAASGGWEPGADDVARAIRESGADGLGTQAQVAHVDEHFLAQLRTAGVTEFHVWTVDDPDVARAYQELGAWGITTNRPGWLRQQLDLKP